MTTLKNQILSKRLAHAYLLSGPRGVGKTTTARLLAKAANCRARASDAAEPCDACDSCADITASRSIDVIEMDAASHTGVDNVREHIIENARFLPTKSPYKIFIIDEVHMLSTAAFNALLKTLEEPPEYVLFILATTELQKLPDTIVSRCQRFSFKKIDDDALRAHLTAVAVAEGVTMDADVLRAIIKKSDGGVRDAVSLLDQLMASGEKHITAEAASLFLPMSQSEDVRAFAEALIQKKFHNALAAIQTLVARNGSATQFAADVIEHMRDLLIAETRTVPVPDLVALIDLLLKRRADIRTSPLPHLPLELAAAEWCAGQESGELKHEPKKGMIVPKIEPLEEKKMIEPEKPVAPEVAERAWVASIEQMEKESPSLASVLRTATVRGVRGSAITLSVPYRFHREQLEASTTRRRVELALAEAAGASLRMEISVDEPVPPSGAADDLSSVATALGGEIVI